ncbi:hypothetical protein DPMN_136633 [Dreissena polymorpha]|uniref:Uncharacterized protein n=1 Tax=Dreissena polymorpha TaxID=45954 RepID=A0A9D4JDZ0_DREPO|nr:hypothetical protein DPMN_136633 [Dreissena polymorpha]
MLLKIWYTTSFVRKRKASRSRTRSPSVKKPKDGSPALSTHSKRSAREPVAEKEPEADKHSDKVHREIYMSRSCCWFV